MKNNKIKNQGLVIENTKFAKDLAFKFRNSGVEIDELQSASVMGLCEAAILYDESKGVLFKTFAYAYCVKYIHKAITDCTMPMTVPERWRNDVEMLHLDLSFEAFGSADADDGTDADRLLYAVAEPTQDEVMVKDEDCSILRKLMADVLTDKEQRVISLRYGLTDDALSREEVAKVMGISKERVRQTERHALGKLRNREIKILRD